MIVNPTHVHDMTLTWQDHAENATLEFARKSPTCHGQVVLPDPRVVGKDTQLFSAYKDEGETNRALFTAKDMPRKTFVGFFTGDGLRAVHQGRRSAEEQKEDKYSLRLHGYPLKLIHHELDRSGRPYPRDHPMAMANEPDPGQYPNMQLFTLTIVPDTLGLELDPRGDNGATYAVVTCWTCCGVPAGTELTWNYKRDRVGYRASDEECRQSLQNQFFEGLDTLVRDNKLPGEVATKVQDRYYTSVRLRLKRSEDPLGLEAPPTKTGTSYETLNPMETLEGRKHYKSIVLSHIRAALGQDTRGAGNGAIYEMPLACNLKSDNYRKGMYGRAEAALCKHTDAQYIFTDAVCEALPGWLLQEYRFVDLTARDPSDTGPLRDAAAVVRAVTDDMPSDRHTVVELLNSLSDDAKRVLLGVACVFDTKILQVNANQWYRRRLRSNREIPAVNVHEILELQKQRDPSKPIAPTPVSAFEFVTGNGGTLSEIEQTWLMQVRRAYREAHTNAILDGGTKQSMTKLWKKMWRNPNPSAYVKPKPIWDVLTIGDVQRLVENAYMHPGLRRADANTEIAPLETPCVKRLARDQIEGGGGSEQDPRFQKIHDVNMGLRTREGVITLTFAGRREPFHLGNDRMNRACGKNLSLAFNQQDNAHRLSVENYRTALYYKLWDAVHDPSCDAWLYEDEKEHGFCIFVRLVDDMPSGGGDSGGGNGSGGGGGDDVESEYDVIDAMDSDSDDGP